MYEWNRSGRRQSEIYATVQSREYEHRTSSTLLRMFHSWSSMLAIFEISVEIYNTQRDCVTGWPSPRAKRLWHGDQHTQTRTQVRRHVQLHAGNGQCGRSRRFLTKDAAAPPPSSPVLLTVRPCSPGSLSTFPQRHKDDDNHNTKHTHTHTQHIHTF